MAEGGQCYDDQRLPQDMNDVQFNRYLQREFDEFHQKAAREPAAAVPSIPVEPDVYNFNYKKRGLAIIFSNRNFAVPNQNNENESLRLEGNEFDENTLKYTFDSFGFDVLICLNYTAERMLLTAKRAATCYGHEAADCFICVLITHGDESTDRTGFVYGYDWKPVSTKSIVESFNDDNCQSLKNKPRLFFVQACRGKKEDKGVNVTFQDNIIQVRQRGISTSNHTVVEEVGGGDGIISDPIQIRPVPLYRDCMIMYATCSGYKAFGNTAVGSPLLHELCMLLLKDERLKEMSFLRGLTSVSGKVALTDTYIDVIKNGVNVGEKCVKAMPVIDSMLTKDIIMTLKIPVQAIRKRKGS